MAKMKDPLWKIEGSLASSNIFQEPALVPDDAVPELQDIIQRDMGSSLSDAALDEIRRLVFKGVRTTRPVTRTITGRTRLVSENSPGYEPVFRPEGPLRLPPLTRTIHDEFEVNVEFDFAQAEMRMAAALLGHQGSAELPEKAPKAKAPDDVVEALMRRPGFAWEVSRGLLAAKLAGPWMPSAEGGCERRSADGSVVAHVKHYEELGSYAVVLFGFERDINASGEDALRDAMLDAEELLREEGWVLA